METDPAETVTAVMALANVLKCAQALLVAVGEALELTYLPCPVQAALDCLFGDASQGMSDLAMLLANGFATT